MLQIVVGRAHTVDGQMDLLLTIGAKMVEEPYKLLIVDSIMALFRSAAWGVVWPAGRSCHSCMVQLPYHGGLMRMASSREREGNTVLAAWEHPCVALRFLGPGFTFPGWGPLQCSAWWLGSMHKPCGSACWRLL